MNFMNAAPGRSNITESDHRIHNPFTPVECLLVMAMLGSLCTDQA